MKRKISVLMIITLLCMSSVVIFNKDFGVEASGEGDGDEDIGLDYNYIWNRTVDFCNVTYDAYEPGEIPKGRSFGSKGGDYTVKYILKPQMENMSLEDVHTEQIKHIDGIYDKNYTTIINITDFEITVNNASGNSYQYENPVPKKEMFVIACGFPPDESEELTANFTFTNAKIKPNNMTKLWPFAGTFNNFHFNSTNFESLRYVSPFVVGNVTYIASDEEVPSPNEQYGRVFLFDDTSSTLDKLDDVTRATASIVIDTGADNGIGSADTSNCPASVVSINTSDGNYLKELLENYTVLVDNVTGNLTFTYNLSNGSWWSFDYVLIDRIPDHYELWNITFSEGRLINSIRIAGNVLARISGGPIYDKPHILHYTGCASIKSVFLRWINDFKIKKCRGIFLYDSYDYHYMLSPKHFWNTEPPSSEGLPWRDYLSAIGGGLGNTGALPIFTMNYSVGDFLNTHHGNTTVTGYSDQVYQEETANSTGVEAYNVVGNITIDKSPDNAIAIISNRYDGMWGSTPGDSGVGGAIVLGIAKYFKDHNITPKYNLTFLFTTGEEYGFRGAWHYNDSHPYNDTPPYDNNIKYWFILDQLCFDQPDTALCLYYKNKDHKKIINEIMKKQTRYWDRTGYDNLTFNDDGAGSEQVVASSRENCDSFCFVKDQDYRWDHWHRAGANYTEGDVLNHTDRNDVNVTAELVWNITKYFLVDPNCWFQNITHELWDDPDDNNSIPDHINVSYTIDTIMPRDRVKVKAYLYQPLSNWRITARAYTITRNGTTDYINFSLEEDAPTGIYWLGVYLYNSTGEINDNVYMPLSPGKYANDSYTPFGIYSGIQMSACNDAPYVSNQPTSSTTNLKAGTSYSYSTSTTDPNGDQVYYQWNYYDTTLRTNEYSSWMGPYTSGATCTVTHTWTTTDDKQVSVRARDKWFSPNLWSDWSDPLNVSVDPGCSILDAPSLQLVDQSFNVNGAVFGFGVTNWSWNFGDGQGDTDFTPTASNTYASINNYTINLTVKDIDSNEYYFEADVQVVPLKADFTITPSIFAHPLETFNFTDNSAGEYSIVNWTWSFGDGNVSYSQNTSHNYSLNGKYDVTLTVKDTQNNTSNCTKKVYVDSVSPEIASVYHCSDTVPGETMPFTYLADPVGIGFDIVIHADFLDNISAVETAKVKVTKPDGTWQNYSMSTDEGSPRDYEYTYEDTWQIGRYTYTVWAEDYADNSNCSQVYSFTVGHLFGYTTAGSLNQTVEDRITGSVFTVNKNGTADDITAYIQTNLSTPPKTKCMIYKKSDSTLIGTTEELTPTTGDSPTWMVFNFTGSKPTLVKNTEYVLTCWSNDTCYLYYDNISTSGRYKNLSYGSPPDPVNWTGNEARLYSIYCSYTTKPEITNVSDTPGTVGFGFNVTISADVDDNGCGIDTVKVNVSYPNNSSGNFTMSNTGGDTYEYVFNDTWLVGQYNYSIWAFDNYGGCNNSSGHSFNVSANATISVCTIKDSYGDNETINLTDPPLVGYGLLDGGDVLRIWNKFDSYYFNTSSGIQITNHYDEYWSHNVLMLGYYDDEEWNLIYRTDELSGFNKEVESDNETFVNATLWKDLAYNGYDFRLAIRYYLGVDDNNLTVIPYIKNLDGDDIPYVLGFGWEMKDIQINMTPAGDYIYVNRTMYLLNQTLNNTYTDLSEPQFYLMENITDTNTKSLYLKWNGSLTYKLQVESREGQYNAPVTLFVRIGTLNVGQEKYTEMYWYDADQVTYYFDSYDDVPFGEAWATNPSYMVDGNPSNPASTTSDGDVELCNGNNCSGSDLGTISMVEFRVSSYYSGSQRDTVLRPVFGGTTDGLDYIYQTPSGAGAGWSPWFDITFDPGAPQTWTWTNVVNLDCDVEAKIKEAPPFTLYCSMVEVRVTYTANNPPVVSNPYPADGSTGVSLTPVLNITVSDADGDSMNITWSSNSSGSWQVFGTNNSVGNGTYHQTFSNATENGKWWYWKVNVTDGTEYIESSVYKFYTGCQSKIKNIGSTDIKGYLLIQVQYYNNSSTWVVADDTINETTPRTINSSEQLGLDTVFNGLVNTSNLSSFGNGTYRIYAAFRDPDGNILVTDDETQLVATYEFTITFE